jgi:hypothetical protein
VPGQLLEGSMWGLKLLDGVVAMANLQHIPPAFAVDAVVEVLLAAKGSQVTAESVIRAQQYQRLFDADLWAWQTGTMNQRGERHTTTPGVVLLNAYLAIESMDKQPPSLMGGAVHFLGFVSRFDICVVTGGFFSEVVGV